MDTQLTRRVQKYNGLYYYEGLETDYTGRWKILKVDDESYLHIECFEIVEEDVEEVITFTRPSCTLSKRLLFWTWEETIPGFTREERVIRKKVRAKVTWVNEYALMLSTTEEYINECSGGCDEIPTMPIPR